MDRSIPHIRSIFPSRKKYEDSLCHYECSPRGRRKPRDPPVDYHQLLDATGKRHQAKESSRKSLLDGDFRSSVSEYHKLEGRNPKKIFNVSDYQQMCLDRLGKRGGEHRQEIQDMSKCLNDDIYNEDDETTNCAYGNRQRFFDNSSKKNFTDTDRLKFLSPKKDPDGKGDYQNLLDEPAKKGQRQNQVDKYSNLVFPEDFCHQMYDAKSPKKSHKDHLISLDESIAKGCLIGNGYQHLKNCSPKVLIDDESPKKFFVDKNMNSDYLDILDETSKNGLLGNGYQNISKNSMKILSEDESPKKGLVDKKKVILDKKKGNYNTYTSKTMSERDMRHLERHLSMKKTIRKQISRNLAQAFIDNPEPDECEQNVLEMLKVSLADDRDSGHSSPSHDDDEEEEEREGWRRETKGLVEHRETEKRSIWKIFSTRNKEKR